MHTVLQYGMCMQPKANMYKWLSCACCNHASSCTHAASYCNRHAGQSASLLQHKLGLAALADRQHRRKHRRSQWALVSSVVTASHERVLLCCMNLYAVCASKHETVLQGVLSIDAYAAAELPTGGASQSSAQAQAQSASEGK